MSFRLLLRAGQGAQDSFAQWFLQDLRWKADTRPFFMPVRGAKIQPSNSSPEFMETRGVLPSLRTVAAPADCIRPRTGNGRNRYVPAASACRGSVVNRYARVLAGAAGRDGLTWHGFYPAVLFSVYSANSTIITEIKLYLYAVIQQTARYVYCVPRIDTPKIVTPIRRIS